MNTNRVTPPADRANRSGGFKLWPHGILAILGCAIIGGAAALLWTKYERPAAASALPNAARIQRVDGQVGLNRSLDNQANNQWTEATTNTPVSVGDRIYTRENSRTEIAFTGRNSATIDPNTSLDVLDLSNQRTQVALRDGSGLFDISSLAGGDLFEVATPCGAVDLQQPGLYQIGIDNGGNATATALSGRAQLVGNGGSSTIEKGETLNLSCQDQSAALSRVDANQAGVTVDNYYHYRYPRKYDGRYRNYYTYLDDPYYYDPSRNYSSYNYVSDYVPGIDDLDDYGEWQNVSNYGYCWHPRVDASWAPYQSGSWTMDYPYGLTWVSNEPWGYAPYHYGRWTNVSNEWFWVPEPVRTYPTYSPALVAFIPFGNSSAAWVALGPGDPYAPRYYGPNWDPVYLSRTNVIQERIVNINVPGAVTVVPAQDFTRVIDRTVITRVDPQTFTRVRSVLDPLTIDPLRRAAFETRAAQRRVDVPQMVAQRINTPVVTSSAPIARPFRRDLAQAMRVQEVSGRGRENRLQVRDDRARSANQTVSQPGNLAAEQARERQIADLSRQAARGDRAARQQMQTLQRQQGEQQRADRFAAQQAQGERVRQQMQTQNALRQQQQTQRETDRQQQQAQREAARQQMIQSRQQRRSEAPQPLQMRRNNQRPPEVQRTQPQVQRAQPQVMRRSEQPQRVQQPQPQRQPRPQVERQVRPPQAQPAPVRVRPPQAQAQPRVERQQQPAKQPPEKRKKPLDKN
jgi:hypothetical protein